MGHWLAGPGDARQHGWVKRFDPLHWTVDFPRPMMAAVTMTGPEALRVDAVFYTKGDLAGLIWEAEDRWDHPLLRYETSRDFRRCSLRFRWRSAGMKPLDAVHGPTLTIEGRDEAGQARSWYVRLWNYADGGQEDAEIDIDFGAVAGGWGGEDPVWAGDVDRMFISLCGADYDGSGAALPGGQEGWAELSGMACDGSGSVLKAGDVLVPEHELRIATGYDDLYHLTPARVLRNCLQLGYRGLINHYVGMSHYFRLEPNSGGLYASLAGGALNRPCSAWHRDFAERAKAIGYELILSLSYELFDAHCWGDWKQRASDGSPALTGWAPPSTLLSPSHAGAMAYLLAVARAFVAIAGQAGLPVRFQVGEPWWWVHGDGRICIYDAAAVADFAPVPIGDVRSALDPLQQATLDRAGARLAASTAALCQAVRAEAPGAQTLLLVYLPSVMQGEVRRANVPIGWARPAFDVLQLEDYDWVTSARRGASANGRAEASARLGYAPHQQHYLAGFVLGAEDKARWREIAEAARDSGAAETFVWALPQVMRDGFTWFQLGEDEVDSFDDVLFPLALGREASVEPAFSTQVVTTASGHERRNSDWADARLRFDAGPAVRSESELGELVAFFRARRGAAVAFRFQDPFDHQAEAQLLGTGDGVRTDFALVKHYGRQERRITRPVAGSLRVALDGTEQASGWTLEEKGVVRFIAPPAAGQEVRASFTFDVPVRFAEDRLQFSRSTFAAGEMASVPLIEVREA